MNRKPAETGLLAQTITLLFMEILRENLKVKICHKKIQKIIVVVKLSKSKYFVLFFVLRIFLNAAIRPV